MASLQGAETDISLSTVDVDGATLMRAAAAAELAGFDAVWVYDHLSGAVLGGSSAHDVWGILAAVAHATDRVGLGPLVLNAAVRHPAHVATAAATLQDLSGGRLRLGLGAGAGPESPYSRELSMLGLPVDGAAARRAAVADTVGYLRSLWRREPSFAGASVSFTDVEGLAHPDPLPPIIVGANGPRMAALAGRLADGVNLHFWEPDLDGLIAVSREAASDAGRTHFEVSVEGPFEHDWLDTASATRRRLAALGVSRVMVQWTGALGIAGIEAAAPLLADGVS